MSLFDESAAPVSFTLARLIKCVEREIGQREFVYPKRVAARSMSQAKADEEIAAMKAVADILRKLEQTEGKS